MNARVRELRRINRALESRGDNYGRAPEGFVANVVETSGGSVVRRLKGLASLIEAGHEVRTRQFELFVLVIDGTDLGHVGGLQVLEPHANGVDYAALRDAGWRRI
jgi:hypothetical protein